MDLLRLFPIVASLLGLGCAWHCQDIGHFTLNDAAFVSLLPSKTNSNGYDLVVSTFNALPNTKDHVAVVRDVGSQLAGGVSNCDVQTLAEDLLWPNEVEEVPEDVFGHSNLWWVACGFLVPTKTDGYNAFIENSHDNAVSPAPWSRVTETCEDDSSRTAWFYHRIAFVDVDGDGLKDMVSSRAYVPTFGEPQAYMVWFKHPHVTDPLSTCWKETIMFAGPDSMFRYHEMPLPNGKTRYMFLSTQYFSEKLVLSWADGYSFAGATGGGYIFNHRVIDSTQDERYFDSEIVDLNGDGVLDFLVTANSDYNGKLLAYEVPWDDLGYGSFVKHCLADGFKPHGIVTGEGNGSPGLAFSVKPSISESRSKPIIIMTGDDDQCVYIFEANSESGNDWSYTKNIIFQASRGTVGAPAAKDVDNDGNIEIFIPTWTDGEVHVVTYEP